MSRDVLNDAIYETVHDYPGGAPALAPKVGMNPGTLQHKANSENETHHLTLRESIPIQLYLRDFRILHKYAHLLDHAAIPLGDYSRTSDLELLDLYAKYHTDIGDTAKAIRDALASPCGRITRKAVRQVRRELIEDMQAGLEVWARLDGMAEGDDDE